MPGVASGLQRDLRLIRRRAWVFIPFLIIGIFIAISFRSVAGDANAVASMRLETVVQDVVLGGDRGLRVFEAQSMTQDAPFKEKVIAAIGDPNFDYSRFAVSLAPISVADGVSSGILTVSISDAKKAEAERLRAAFVQVYTEEYTAPKGLFRERFLLKKREVADLAEREYEAAKTIVRPKLEQRGLPADEVIRSQGGPASLIGELSTLEARYGSELAQINGALAIPGGNTGIQASIILGVTVTNDAAQVALQTRREILNSTLAQIQLRRAAISDLALEKELLFDIDNVRTLAAIRDNSFVRLNNAKVATTSAQSSIQTSLSFSGGVAGTLTGRIAVALAFTIVFGIIAIYGWEWLGQVRSANKA